MEDEGVFVPLEDIKQIALKAVIEMAKEIQALKERVDALESRNHNDGK